MSGIRRLVLDTLIPLEISSIDLAKKISRMKGVESIDIRIQEVERKVEVAKITIVGKGLDFEYIRKAIENTGSSIQSVDRITCGKSIIE